MKKVLLMCLLSLTFLLFGCSKEAIGRSEGKIELQKPIESPISKQGEYSLDCSTKYYTNTNIGGEIIKETYVKISEGHERNTLYIDGENAKFFGANFKVLQDDTNSLIIMRLYEPSGLTEVVTINKNSGIGFDVKTLGFGIGGVPVSDTYILSCLEI